MGIEAPLFNDSVDDLIRKYRYCGDPVAERLVQVICEQQDEIDYLETPDPIGDESEDCDECDRLERENDRLEDKVSDLDEQIDHLNNRIDEFAQENRELLARLKAMEGQANGNKTA